MKGKQGFKRSHANYKNTIRLGLGLKSQARKMQKMARGRKTKSHRKKTKNIKLTNPHHHHKQNKKGQKPAPETPSKKQKTSQTVDIILDNLTNRNGKRGHVTREAGLRRLTGGGRKPIKRKSISQQ